MIGPFPETPGEEGQRGSCEGWEVFLSFSEHMEYPGQLSSGRAPLALQQLTGLCGSTVGTESQGLAVALSHG